MTKIRNPKRAPHMTVKAKDAANNKDWQFFCLHYEAMRLWGAIATLTTRISKEHGTQAAVLAACEAQAILNGKEKKS